VARGLEVLFRGADDEAPCVRGLAGALAVRRRGRPCLSLPPPRCNVRPAHFGDSEARDPDRL